MQRGFTLAASLLVVQMRVFHVLVLVVVVRVARRGRRGLITLLDVLELAQHLTAVDARL